MFATCPKLMLQQYCCFFHYCYYSCCYCSCHFVLTQFAFCKKILITHLLSYFILYFYILFLDFLCCCCLFFFVSGLMNACNSKGYISTHSLHFFCFLLNWATILIFLWLSVISLCMNFIACIEIFNNLGFTLHFKHYNRKY